MSHAAPLAGYQYAGAELELLETAANWKRYWSRRITPYIHGDVLEAGAGIGANTALLAALPVCSWTCLEPDAALLARIPLPTARHRAIAGTTASLAPADTFDSILYIDVLEHIEDDAAELQRAVRHLRHGGHLIVLAPAWPFLYSPFDTAIGHFRRYTRSTLRSAARAATQDARRTGAPLTETALFYLDSAGMLASAANRILRRAVPTPSQIRFWDRRLIPLSLRLDPLLGHRLGRSVVAVWEKRHAG